MRMLSSFLLGICLILSAYTASASEMKIIFYGYYVGGRNITYYIDDKQIYVRDGEVLRHEFNGFDETEGLNIDLMDIVSVVDVQRLKLKVKTLLKLEVYPKIAKHIYFKSAPDDSYKILDLENTERTAKWQAPIIRKIKKINVFSAVSTVETNFEKINLKALIKKCSQNGKWPIELKIEISVITQDKEHHYQAARFLRIPLPAH